ncbi:hypothetical protein Xen7305DRAFT_00017670 [Xenococcus sp. PCC 7305]|uniref:type I restriction endonuclease n=1 Tax=Xenococcus sp. PCC 7305 TaxID=102125 RepID=UPI0002AC6DAF|nr:type I restriction endonuclease [Xenococcus sp. PCC 7305]ELS02056.1 hypothetical protein Xen7305DRAFT_00017670 [Xenococcus sp. PCC 7305]
MDFIDRVKAFAASVPQKLDSIKTEEATKNFLIMPFIQQILGYNPFDPNELIPEYDANVGASKKFKLDYAILQDGQPVILVECKCYGIDINHDRHYTQLFSYFASTDARIGVLTDGVVYHFFADLDRNNRMDKKPFLVIDLLNLNESVIKELSKLTKSAFDVSNAISSASELKYVGGIKALLRQQLKAPNDEFTKYFFRELCPENAYTGRLKQDFLGYTLRGIKEFITEEMKNLLDDAVNPPKVDPKDDLEDLHTGEKTEFTEDERDGFYILRGILSSVVKPSRITYRDTQNYCNILLDNNGSRQIVRLHFNNPKNRKLEIYSIDINGDKSSEKVSIVELDEIYKHADQFKAIVDAYEQRTLAK